MRNVSFSKSILAKSILVLAMSVSAGTLLAASAAHAQMAGDASDMQAALCDALAGHPLDRDKPKEFLGVNIVAKSDADAAVSACQNAAKAGSTSDASVHRFSFELGRALEAQGKMDEALDAYRWAARTGSTIAMVTLALFQIEGTALPKDPVKAFQLLQDAADQGDVTAMTNLGAVYAAGVGTHVNLPEAKRWYELAAGADDGEAMFQLGLMARDGNAGPRDDTDAKRWFEKAFAQNNVDAMIELGHFAEVGRAGPKNLVMALRFYEMAAALGSANGKANVARLQRAFGLNSKPAFRMTSSRDM